MHTPTLNDYMASPPVQATEQNKVPVEMRKGIKGLDTIVLRDRHGSSAEVLLYGAQVISWKNPNGDEMLFVSSKADSTPNIIGGISICFPEIRDHESLDPHVITRNRLWTVDCSPPPLQSTSLNNVYVDLILTPNETDLQIWPHRFEYRLRITLGTLGELILTSRIRNTNTTGLPFSFSFAYRNYLGASDISKVCIKGLETVHYLDKLKNMERSMELGSTVTFESKIAVIDYEEKHTIFIRKSGLPAVGVWNPWKKKARQIGGFEEKVYKKMVCVEPCSVDETITLRPGEEWRGQQELYFEPYTYVHGLGVAT